MKKDKNQIVKEVVESLLAMFESGKMPERMAFSIIRKQRGEDIPSTQWSIGNRLLMLAQDTDDARGFKQWQQVDRHVKKGAKALYILAPVIRKIKDKDDIGEEKDKVIPIGFTPIPVFRYEDTEGEDLSYRKAYQPAEYPPFWDVADVLGLTVTYAPLMKNYLGRYNLRTKNIKLCAHDAIVYFHELSHAVHSTFVDLQVYDPEKAEIIAEFSACVLCEIQGICGYEQQGLAYIKRYCRKDDKLDSVLKKITSVLTDVDLIVTKVLETAEKIDRQKDEAM